MSKSRTPEEAFPERLRRAREVLRKLSQGELADKSGLQPSAISHFETGTRKPSFDNLRRLADALSVSTDYLLGRVDAPGAVGKTVDALLKDFQNASAADQEWIRDILESRMKRSKKDPT